jgi:glyceraldehyde 3-phosphate dehydrogenase
MRLTVTDRISYNIGTSRIITDEGFLRVPGHVVSMVDLVCEVKRETTVEEVNNIFKERANKKEFKGILSVEDEPLVSTDYIGNAYSSILDLPLTMVNGNIVKLMSWYDNEWGYSTRLAEIAEYISKCGK